MNQENSSVEQTQSEQAVSETVVNDQNTTEPAASETVASEPVAQEPAKSETRKKQGDRIAELTSRLARMEACYALRGANVVDEEVCVDLMMKGYTLEQLKQSKPYLFKQEQSVPTQQTVVKKAPTVVAATQAPKTQEQNESSNFVKQLASMLISKF